MPYNHQFWYFTPRGRPHTIANLLNVCTNLESVLPLVSVSFKMFLLQAFWSIKFRSSLECRQVYNPVLAWIASAMQTLVRYDLLSTPGFRNRIGVTDRLKRENGSKYYNLGVSRNLNVETTNIRGKQCNC